MLEFSAAVLSVLGYIFVMYENKKGFLLFISANMLWIVFTVINNHKFQLVMFVTYSIISLFSYIRWSKEKTT